MTRLVFILGAGASYDLDDSFPVGALLATKIEQTMQYELSKGPDEVTGPIARAILSRGDLRPAHFDAMRRIRQGIQTKNSIDEFVDEWSDMPHMVDIAKISIAHQILHAERSSKIYQFNNKGFDKDDLLRSLRTGWIGSILDHVNPECRRRDIGECLKGVSFITFNYDRSLQHYLIHSLISTYAVKHADAIEIVSNIPIKHVYGTLGNLTDASSDPVPYGAPEFLIERASRGIRTFTEEIHSDHASDLREIVKSADRIIFLGCAFHEQNLKILFDGPGPKHNFELWGTIYKMRPVAVQKVKNFFSLIRGGGIYEDTQCSALMNGHWESIFRN